MRERFRLELIYHKPTHRKYSEWKKENVSFWFKILFREESFCLKRALKIRWKISGESLTTFQILFLLYLEK